jgi:hypothetical protein
MADVDWAGGLGPQYDYMLTERPEDPEMRESASLWFFDDSGEIGLPRIGIEAQGAVWDQHRFDANVVFPDGRVLRESRRGETKPAIGADGKPSVLAVDNLVFRVVEPFRKWVVSYEGEATDSTIELMIREKFDTGKRVPIAFEIAIDMAAPAWVQDNTPEKLAQMTEQERTDAGLMGYGFRKEQLCTGEGWFEVDGERRQLKGRGLRVHRQSVRPMAAFRGHCWQSPIPRCPVRIPKTRTTTVTSIKTASGIPPRRARSRFCATSWRAATTSRWSWNPNWASPASAPRPSSASSRSAAPIRWA